MPLHCTVLPDEGLALVADEGNVTRSDIKGCLSLFKGQPVDRYGKLINLIHAQLVLGPVDIVCAGIVPNRSRDPSLFPCTTPTTSTWRFCSSSACRRESFASSLTPDLHSDG